MSPALHSAHIALLNTQSSLPSAARILVAAAVLVTKWDIYARSRKTLKTLPPHLLHDIGISRTSALTEAEKRFWQD